MLDLPTEVGFGELIHAHGSHGTVTGCADGAEVVNGGVAALSFRNNMTAVEVADADDLFATAEALGAVNSSTNVLVPD